MRRQFIINRNSHKLVRKLLRERMTEAEKILWKHLRQKQLGFWFKRQVSIGKFIVDYYCPKKRLVIEIDGNIHKYKDHPDYDKQRTWYLKSLNFKVIRFWNGEVVEEVNEVVEKIRDVVYSSPNPSPKLGEGK